MSEPERDAREVLVFTQADIAFGIDARCVEEISETVSITPLPKAEETLRGLMNFKGEILPVFSFFGLLGLPVTDTEKICLIVRDKAFGALALTIESAEGLYKEEADRLLPPDGFHLGQIQPEALWKADKTICVIDLAKTFQKQ